MMKRLSIVIVTYNSEKDIFDCISSIREYSDIPLTDIEIIVVDNASEQCDTMFKRLKELFGNDIKCIKNSKNGGYGQGNNIGIKNANAPIVLIMNPDVRFYEPVFLTALTAFQQNPKLGLLGMKQMLSLDTPSMNSFSCSSRTNGYLYSLLNGFCNRHNLFFPGFMFVQGSCFFLDKEKFESIGMYDEELFLYGEEDDIAYRMKKEYGKCSDFLPQLHYLHLTQDRKPNLEYQKKQLDSFLISNEKKHYPRKRIINNRLQNIRCLIFREQIRLLRGKRDTTFLNMLKDFKSYLNELKKS